MKIKLASCFVAFLVVGCATVEYKPKPEKNDRVVYRLLKAVQTEYQKEVSKAQKVKKLMEKEIEVCKKVEQPIVVKSKAKINKSMKEKYLVAFQNESMDLDYYSSDLSKIESNIDSRATYIVVGHSHGYSQVGNTTLSNGRASAVAEWLVESQGIPASRVHKMSSWSKTSNKLTPAIGVEVYKVRSIGENSMIELTMN